eukprot:PhM_4_TR4215/c0_g1_i1/m.17112
MEGKGVRPSVHVHREVCRELDEQEEGRQVRRRRHEGEGDDEQQLPYDLHSEVVLAPFAKVDEEEEPRVPRREVPALELGRHIYNPQREAQNVDGQQREGDGGALLVVGVAEVALHVGVKHHEHLIEPWVLLAVEDLEKVRADGQVEELQEEHEEAHEHELDAQLLQLRIGAHQNGLTSIEGERGEANGLVLTAVVAAVVRVTLWRVVILVLGNLHGRARRQVAEVARGQEVRTAPTRLFVVARRNVLTGFVLCHDHRGWGRRALCFRVVGVAGAAVFHANGVVPILLALFALRLLNGVLHHEAHDVGDGQDGCHERRHEPRDGDVPQHGRGLLHVEIVDVVDTVDEARTEVYNGTGVREAHHAAWPLEARLRQDKGEDLHVHNNNLRHV